MVVARGPVESEKSVATFAPANAQVAFAELWTIDHGDGRGDEEKHQPGNRDGLPGLMVGDTGIEPVAPPV
jgi:hypothetical protein